MTYSRSHRQQQRRIQQRRTLRKLVWVTVFVAVLAIAGAFVWANRTNSSDTPSPDRPAAADPSAQPTSSATDEAEPTDKSSASAPSSPEPSGEEPSPSAQPSDQEEPTSGEGRVTLAFVGDVLPAAIVEDRMKEHGYDYPYKKVKSYLEAADITAGNLETPISTRGTPMAKKEYVYRGSPDSLPALVEAGFDYMALANNHSLDYGWDALSDTMTHLDDAGIRHSGAGQDDAEAYTPAYIEHDGVTVAYVSLTHVVPVTEWKASRYNPGLAETYAPQRAIAAIEDASRNADLVVVMVHWGKELAAQPLDTQRNLARSYIDAGADLIVGSHPHVLQGFEKYKGRWIAYSLGNFVFPGMKDKETARSGILSADCSRDGDCAISILPVVAEASQPAVADEATAQEIIARLEQISYSVSIGENGQVVAQN